MRPAAKLSGWSILILLVFISFAAILFNSKAISADSFSAIISGFIVSSLNFLLGVAAIKLGYNKSPNAFIKTILGGTVLRLFLMIGMVIAGLKTLELSRNSFIFSVLFFYIFYLVIEIFYLNLPKK